MLTTLFLALDVAFFLTGPRYRDQNYYLSAAKLGKEKGTD